MGVKVAPNADLPTKHTLLGSLLARPWRLAGGERHSIVGKSAFGTVMAKSQAVLFLFLILGAPLSLYPSIEFPLYDFSSFRIGLYQIMALLFVCLTMPHVIQNFVKRKLDKQDKLVFGTVGLLISLTLYGLQSALKFNRSLLMVGSFVFLLVLVVCGYYYAKSQFINYAKLRRYMLVAGCVYGAISILQLLVGSFTSTEVALLCSRCGDAVFGFPRVSGFAAEPLFWANAVIPFFVVALFAYRENKTRLATAALILTSSHVALSFARGALLAIVVIVLLDIVRQGLISKKLLVRGLLVSGMGVSIGFVMLVLSAVVRYTDSPYIAYNTVRGMAEHISLGVIDLPEKLEENTGPTAVSPTETSFVSQGLVEASSNDRLGAAEIAIKVWRMPSNTLLGVGLGNLGPYVVRSIDTSAPSNLTVYIFYVLLLVETGLLGLLLVLVLFGSALMRLWRAGTSKNAQLVFLVLVGFLTQYFFFGSYINVVYIWLWLGIGLGLRVELGHKHDKTIKTKHRTIS